ncbi:MAG: ABC transporter ATP-binding protein [Candidimonas sp.]|jgi:putative spermidine/putrescine transport system ATP-binding protein
MARLQLQGVVKRYGGNAVVQGVDLTVEDGELVALLGPSGCGKTTTLRIVAGFTEPSAGTVRLGDRDITHIPPYARDTGMVFQSYALFPHLNVAQNVGFGLEMRGVNRAERDQRVKQALSLVQLGHLAQRLPRELSGGQQQRVALARALVIKPLAFLLDEPLSNLDAKLRIEVRLQMRALQQRLGLTTLMVTHDQEEALTMADRLVVMDQGRVRQIGTPQELYEHPVDAFVAGFIGRCNLLAGKMEGTGQFRSRSGALLPVGGTRFVAPGPLTFALRPERVRVAPASGTYPGSSERHVSARLTAITYLGSLTEYHADLDGASLLAIGPTPGTQDILRRLSPGDEVFLCWDDDAIRLLPGE